MDDEIIDKGRLTHYISAAVKVMGGPQNWDTPVFLKLIEEHFSQYPAERAAITQLASWFSPEEFKKLRSSADPRKQLAIITDAFITSTGLPRDIATWAVFALNEAFDPLTHQKRDIVSPSDSWNIQQLASSLLIGLAVMISAAAAEYFSQKYFQPSIISLSLHRLQTHETHGVDVRAVGLISVTAGLTAMLAWAVHGSGLNYLPRGIIVTSLASASVVAIENLTIRQRPHGTSVTLSPVIDLIVLLAFLVVIVWITTQWTANAMPAEEADQPGFRFGGDDEW